MNILEALSWLASRPFAAGVAVRNGLFDHGVLRSHEIGVPVISVGNITTGGSGKTPTVLYIINVMRTLGLRVAVVSRGYGRHTRGVVVVSDGAGNVARVADSGDEPALIAQRCSDVIVIVAERRIDAARKAVAMGAQCIVADDAFQHRALARTLDVVIGNEEFGRTGNMLLPCGRGRESPAALKRASVVLSTSLDEAMITREVQRVSAAPVYPCDIVPVDVYDPSRGESHSCEILRGKNAVLLTAIARPARVAATLSSLGARIVDSATFRDHHWFTLDELRAVASMARVRNAVLVTTEKDWIRLAAVNESSVVFGGLVVYVLRVEMTLRRNGQQFDAMIRAAVKIF